MSLRVTQCPGCESTFNTSAAQLQASAGTVRCGVCLTIFQAPQHFIDGVQLPAENEYQSAENSLSTDSTGSPAGGFFTRLFSRKSKPETYQQPIVQTLVPDSGLALNKPQVEQTQANNTAGFQSDKPADQPPDQQTWSALALDQYDSLAPLQEFDASEIVVATVNLPDCSRVIVNSDSAEIELTVSLAGNPKAADEILARHATAYRSTTEELTAQTLMLPDPSQSADGDRVKRRPEDGSVSAVMEPDVETASQHSEMADFSLFKKIDPILVEPPHSNSDQEEDIDLFSGARPKILIQSKVALEIASRQSVAPKQVAESLPAKTRFNMDNNDLAFAPRPQTQIDPQKQRKIFVKPKDPARDSGLVFIKGTDFELTRAQPVRRSANRIQPTFAAVPMPVLADPATASADADLFGGVQVKAISPKNNATDLQNLAPATTELVHQASSAMALPSTSTNNNSTLQRAADSTTESGAGAANDPIAAAQPEADAGLESETTDSNETQATAAANTSVKALSDPAEAMDAAMVSQAEQDPEPQQQVVGPQQAWQHDVQLDDPESAPALSAIAAEPDPDVIRKIALSTKFDSESDLETLPQASLVAVESVTGALVLDAQSQPGRIFRAKTVLMITPLFVLLAAAVLWQQMPRLSLQPALRPWYVRTCQLLPCQVPVYADTDAIRSQNLSVRSHPESSGLLAVTTVFRNEGNFPQPFPVLRLQFTDQRQQTVAQWEFQPSEYLDPSLRNIQLMPVFAPVQAELEMEDPGPEAVNYSLAFVSP